jgi:hypothetical protein
VEGLVGELFVFFSSCSFSFFSLVFIYSILVLRKRGRALLGDEATRLVLLCALSRLFLYTPYPSPFLFVVVATTWGSRREEWH